MQKPGHHFMVCASFRASGTPQGVCHKKGSVNLLQFLESELSDRGMDDSMVTMTGCLKACDRGPVMVVYPENSWYGNMSEDGIVAVLDAMEKGETASQYLLT